MIRTSRRCKPRWSAERISRALRKASRKFWIGFSLPFTVLCKKGAVWSACAGECTGLTIRVRRCGESVRGESVQRAAGNFRIRAETLVLQWFPIGPWRSLASALAWGARGPGFKSRRPDQIHPLRITSTDLRGDQDDGLFVRNEMSRKWFVRRFCCAISKFARHWTAIAVQDSASA